MFVDDERERGREKQCLIVFSFLLSFSFCLSILIGYWTGERRPLSLSCTSHFSFLSLRSTSSSHTHTRIHWAVVWQQKSSNNYTFSLFFASMHLDKIQISHNLNGERKKEDFHRLVISSSMITEVLFVSHTFVDTWEGRLTRLNKSIVNSLFIFGYLCHIQVWTHSLLTNSNRMWENNSVM